MIKQGESFWSAVYPIFMSRDLTRTDLRRIVQTRPGDDERQLPSAGAVVQHGAAGLQALPELPAEARLSPAVPALPRRAGEAPEPGHTTALISNPTHFLVRRLFRAPIDRETGAQFERLEDLLEVVVFEPKHRVRVGALHDQPMFGLAEKRSDVDSRGRAGQRFIPLRIPPKRVGRLAGSGDTARRQSAARRSSA